MPSRPSRTLGTRMLVLALGVIWRTKQPPCGNVSDPEKKTFYDTKMTKTFFGCIERSSILAFQRTRSRLLVLRTDFRGPSRVTHLGALCIGPSDSCMPIRSDHRGAYGCIFDPPELPGASTCPQAGQMAHTDRRGAPGGLKRGDKSKKMQKLCITQYKVYTM